MTKHLMFDLSREPVQGPLTEEQMDSLYAVGSVMVLELADTSPDVEFDFDWIAREAHAMVMEPFELVDDHSCDTWSIEVDTIDCGYCCKRMRCEKCGKEFDSHRKIYGCPQG